MMVVLTLKEIFFLAILGTISLVFLLGLAYHAYKKTTAYVKKYTYAITIFGSSLLGAAVLGTALWLYVR